MALVLHNEGQGGGLTARSWAARWEVVSSDQGPAKSICSPFTVTADG